MARFDVNDRGTVGTLEWAQATGGRLSRRELVRQLSRGIAGQLAAWSARALAGIGLSRSGASVADLEAVTLPDSPAARDAAQRCAQLSPSLIAHSHRTYLWGALLAARDRLTYDPELLYVACLLHDTGLP